LVVLTILKKIVKQSNWIVIHMQWKMHVAETTNHLVVGYPQSPWL
jgi:hypothetical protein